MVSLDILVKIDVFCGGHFGVHLKSVHFNYKLNATNALMVCITMRKVVSHDILSQIVQRLALEFSLAICLIFIMEVLMMRNPP